MKIGACYGWKIPQITLLKECGCDCFEPALFTLAQESDDELKEARRAADDMGIFCAAFNGMLPGNIRLLEGPEGYGAVREYLKTVLPKAKILGGEVVVLGSGSARRIPEGMDHGEALKRFKDVLAEAILPLTREFGYTVAIEELRKEECNFINTAREASEIADALDGDGVGLHIDYFHTVLGGESIDDIANYCGKIRHVHLSSIKHFREYPKTDDVEEFTALRNAFGKAGYDGCATFEGVINGDHRENLLEAVATVRKAGF